MPSGILIHPTAWAVWPRYTNVTSRTSVVVCLSVCLSVTVVYSMYCGQAVGWIKMPLGTEVGLDPVDIVLDRDPAAVKAHVYCGHGRPSQLLLSSCQRMLTVPIVSCRFL